MIDDLLNKPYWIIDIFPEQVPEKNGGRFFAVEKYFVRTSGLAEIHRCFTDVLLKLNCYSDFQVYCPDADRTMVNPAPEALASWISGEQKDLCIILPGEDAMITLNHDDLYMTVYNPPETLLKRIGSLAAAHGLFLRRPGEEA